MVENESILLQTLGKGQDQASVSFSWLEPLMALVVNTQKKIKNRAKKAWEEKAAQESASKLCSKINSRIMGNSFLFLVFMT